MCSTPMRGRPAAGVAIELVELLGDVAPHVIASATTNADGRTDHPLIDGRPMPIGRYDLAFPHGRLLRASRHATVGPAVPRHRADPFRHRRAEGHYHVPLLVTPWSYSTYRGS